MCHRSANVFTCKFSKNRLPGRSIYPSYRLTSVVGAVGRTRGCKQTFSVTYDFLFALSYYTCVKQTASILLEATSTHAFRLATILHRNTWARRGVVFLSHIDKWFASTGLPCRIAFFAFTSNRENPNCAISIPRFEPNGNYVQRSERSPVQSRANYCG